MDGTEEWHIGEVAQMSGVTSRTLRHYHDVGLLVPTRTGVDGTRYYGRLELLRLQRILLLRELGLSLADITTVVDGEVEQLVALRRHRDQYAEELNRRKDVLATVDATIAALGEGVAMRPEDLFDGFDPAQQQMWENDLADRFGEAAAGHVEAAKQRMESWQRSDAAAAVAGFEAVESELARLCARQTPADDPKVQDLVRRHYAVVCRFWQPDADAYTGLGQLYVDHDDFRRRYESRQVGLAEYLRDAMAVFAQGLREGAFEPPQR
jgi:MerR family transcriptional regulator, thiopeptide resistance regulator